MKLWLSVLSIILLASSIYASGPTLPKQYRMPTEDELSSEWRKGDSDKYASVAADFNDDGLVDGAFLVVDEKHKKLVLTVVLINKDFSETWLKLQTMDFAALKYQGIALIKPSTVSVYRGEANENTKHPITLKFNSIRSFSSEGPSSVFFWDPSKHQFQHLWLTK
ncbi:MAG: hypothetical protein MUP30_12500 [Deltaproteobacteria bacterium]|nr:hypothetical protein [Deltaproteobacteria bacterium]